MHTILSIGQLRVESELERPISLGKIDSPMPFRAESDIYYRYTNGDPLNPYTLVIRSGFEFDGASIPGRVFAILWLLNILSPLDRAIIIAAGAHDKLYTTHELPRIVADAIFEDLVSELTKRSYLASWMFWAVRKFGGTHWKPTDVLPVTPPNLVPPKTEATAKVEIEEATAVRREQVAEKLETAIKEQAIRDLG